MTIGENYMGYKEVGHEWQEVSNELEGRSLPLDPWKRYWYCKNCTASLWGHKDNIPTKYTTIQIVNGVYLERFSCAEFAAWLTLSN